MQYVFSDLVAAPDFQQILESFYSGCGITAQILELDSQMIVASSGQDIYSEFHQDVPQSILRSWQIEKESFPQNKDNLSWRYEGIGGLFRYARAIYIEGREIAILFLGPLFHTAQNEDSFNQMARESGFDVEAYLEAVRKIPIVPEEKAEGYLDLLVQFLQRMLVKGLNELRLTEKIAVAQERQENQQRAYHELEARIWERTEELERANAALQESEQRFRVALIDTPVVVFNQDLELRYTWIYNPQNYADQPVVGKTDTDLFSPEDAMRLIALKKRVIAAGLLTREEVSLTVGDKIDFYDMTLDPLYDANGNVTGLTCAATNITERKQVAVLEERQRLARQLHDSVTQALYSMTLYADAARLALSRKQWKALERNLQEVRHMAREAMYDMRLLVLELRPFMLEKEGLVSALRARLAAVEGRAGLKSEVLIEGERRIPIDIEEEIYRIAQEGFNNVVKHAKANEVQIHLKYYGNKVLLEMIDDGIGFDPEDASRSGGVGLQGLKERVHRLGGDFQIDSKPGKGTRLKVEIPF